MENETQAEHIADRFVFSLHVFDVDDLRSNITRGTAPNKKILLSVGKLRKPEISNHTLCTSRRSEDKVLRFEVSMHYRLTMHFPQPTENRKDDFPDLMRSEFVLRLDLVIE